MEPVYYELRNLEYRGVDLAKVAGAESEATPEAATVPDATECVLLDIENGFSPNVAGADYLFQIWEVHPRRIIKRKARQLSARARSVGSSIRRLFFK